MGACPTCGRTEPRPPPPDQAWLEMEGVPGDKKGATMDGPR